VDDLLALAIDAHGGMRRWDRLSRFTAAVSISGSIWDRTERPGLLTDVVLDGDTRVQRLRITSFPTAGHHATWEPSYQTIETAEGAVLADRRRPAFPVATPDRLDLWDDFQVIRFASEASWNNLVSPFVLARPGFVAREIEPWPESCEVWRRLSVSLPGDVAAPSRNQTYYFDGDGYLRRLDYVLDVLGGALAVEFPSDYRDFDGITVPTRRIVHERHPDGSPALGPPWVVTDVTRVTFR
jgi:hypothetical protein